LKGRLLAAPLLVLGRSKVRQGRWPAADEESPVMFQPITLSADDRVIVSPGFAAQLLIRWGDPLHLDVPPFDMRRQSAALQAQQFGYNGDLVAYFSLPHHLAGNASHGILAVNHECTNPGMMVSGYVPGSPTREQVDVQLAAHILAGSPRPILLRPASG
jgi:uncharacterized protein